MLKAKLGISPICWWNDDLVELSDDVSLEECLRQASVAGYTGMETGRRFPMTMDELGPILAKYGISVCGGWFSGTILEGDLEENKDRIRAQMDLFIAAKAPASFTARLRARFRATVPDPCLPSRNWTRRRSQPMPATRPPLANGAQIRACRCPTITTWRR